MGEQDERTKKVYKGVICSFASFFVAPFSGGVPLGVGGVSRSGKPDHLAITFYMGAYYPEALSLLDSTLEPLLLGSQAIVAYNAFAGDRVSSVEHFPDFF